MPHYKNILLALELEPKSDALIIEKAKEIQKIFNGKLILVHAIEYLLNYGAAYAVIPGVDVEEMLAKEAQKKLNDVGESLEVDEKNLIVEIGSAKHVILEKAEEKKANLIIIGSHGRHGFRLLLGSTANAVLHGAKCDVLAVRVKE